MHPEQELHLGDREGPTNSAALPVPKMSVPSALEKELVLFHHGLRPQCSQSAQHRARGRGPTASNHAEDENHSL